MKWPCLNIKVGFFSLGIVLQRVRGTASCGAVLKSWRLRRLQRGSDRWPRIKRTQTCWTGTLWSSIRVWRNRTKEHDIKLAIHFIRTFYFLHYLWMWGHSAVIGGLVSVWLYEVLTRTSVLPKGDLFVVQKQLRPSQERDKEWSRALCRIQWTRDSSAYLTWRFIRCAHNLCCCIGFSKSGRFQTSANNILCSSRNAWIFPHCH